jgi:hypothetical protein
MINPSIIALKHAIWIRLNLLATPRLSLQRILQPYLHNMCTSLLRFVVVRSGYDEGLGRIIFRSIFLTLRWQKKEERRLWKEEVPQFRLQECWPSFVGYLFSRHLPSVCMCGHSCCRASNRLGFKLCYSQYGYYFVIQSACNVLYNIILLLSQKKPCSFSSVRNAFNQ